MRAAVVIPVLWSAVAVCGAVMMSTPPENCGWTPRDGASEEVTLSCNLRANDSGLDNSSFALSQAESVTELRVLCHDVLSSQLSLQPRVFQRLHNLDTLTIERCKLRELHPGTFLGLGSMRRLTVRSYNNDGSIMFLSPDSLEGMPLLEQLNLGQNNIRTLPGRVFCPLPALRHLNLAGNNLQDTSEVGAANSCAAHLVTLDLSWNDLLVLPEAGLVGLGSLQALHLPYCNLSMLADRALLGLSALNLLNLSSNHLTTLPLEVFNDTLSLTELYLHNNSLSELPPNIFSPLTRLTVLDLSNNLLTSERVAADTFRGLVQLMALNLSHNRLTEVSVDMLRDLTVLQVLDLSHNNLVVVSDQVTFSPLVNLRRLDLSHNALEAVYCRTFANLYTLSSLSLAYNNIHWVSSDAFENCTSLSDLYLEHNLLQDVPAAVHEAIALKTLKLSHNQFTSINQDDFSGLVALRHLDLSSNFIRSLCKLCLAGLSGLETLDLSRNELGSVPHGAFDNNTKLELLRMDGNNISDINDLFASLSNLRVLNVSANNIQWFDYAFVPRQLQHLHLHDNHITELGNYYRLEDWLQLKVVDASHNRLEELSRSSVPTSVQLLLVNNNRITSVEANTFHDKHSLSVVNLSHNLLTHLSYNAVQHQAVPEGRALPEFYLGGNPILCDCRMEWLQRAHHINGSRFLPRFMDLDKVICTVSYPRVQENYLPILDVQPSQFLCRYATHCYALCHCCDFMNCDCRFDCPEKCSCYHDSTWSTNIKDCQESSYSPLK